MHMQEKELLELAAKAAGVDAQWDCPARGMMVTSASGCDTDSWNPLVSDGDALRLAVKLQLTVCNEHVSCGAAYCIGEHGIDYPIVSGSPDGDEITQEDYAATRRAIVRAAAEIGLLTPNVRSEQPDAALSRQVGSTDGLCRTCHGAKGRK